MALSDMAARQAKATGKPYTSVTSTAYLLL